MSRRGAWKSKATALAAADPELVIRLQGAVLDARKIDEPEALESAALAVGDRLPLLKRAAPGLPGAAALVAQIERLANAQASRAVDLRRKLAARRARKAEQLAARGYGGDVGGWIDPEPASRRAIVRALFAVENPPHDVMPRALALAAVAIGLELEPADADAWRRLHDLYRDALRPRTVSKGGR